MGGNGRGKWWLELKSQHFQTTGWSIYYLMPLHQRWQLTFNEFAFICTGPTTALALGWQHLNKQSRHHPLLLYAHTPLEPKLGLQWLPLTARDEQWQGSPGSARLHCVGLRWPLIKSCFWHEMHVAHNSEMQMASTSFNGEMKNTLVKIISSISSSGKDGILKKEANSLFLENGQMYSRKTIVLLEVINRENKQKSLSSKR